MPRPKSRVRYPDKYNPVTMPAPTLHYGSRHLTSASRPLSPRTKRVILVLGVILLAILLAVAEWARRGWVCYGDYLDTRSHLRQLGFSLNQYAIANAGQYPQTLSSLPSDPSANFLIAFNGFKYLGTGLVDRKPGGIGFDLQSPIREVIVARARPRYDNGDNVLFADGAVDFIPDTDLPAALARSAAARAKWEASTRPATRP